MTVRGEDVTVTQDDVTASMRSANLTRIDKYLQTASEQEARKVRGWAEHRLMNLGAIEPARNARIADRMIGRLAIESVPILLTLLVFIPLVSWVGVMIFTSEAFRPITYACPPTCESESLILLAALSGLGFLIILLAFYSVRKFLLNAWK